MLRILKLVKVPALDPYLCVIYNVLTFLLKVQKALNYYDTTLTLLLL